METAVFSMRYIEPKWNMKQDVVRYPLSSVMFYLKPEKVENRRHYIENKSIDKRLFLEYMEEWGVWIQRHKF